MNKHPNEEEFLKKMENLQVPQVNPEAHQNITKMTILNASRSAALGVWLIVVPCYFLFCVFMYYFFHRQLSWFGAMFDIIVSMDKNPYLDILGPILMVGLPIVCIIMNALAITHVHYNKLDPAQGKVKEFNVTIKIKLWNIMLILISLAIIFTFIGFAMTENISIKR